MKDLFGRDVEPEVPVERGAYGSFHRKGTHPKARASTLPGPEGETCKSCEHSYKQGVRSGRGWYKCAIAQRKATHGAGTDIRLKDPACSRFKKIVD
jgi:hypothetical protein